MSIKDPPRRRAPWLSLVGALAAVPLLTSSLASHQAAQPVVKWKEEKSKKGQCTKPMSFCAAKLQDSQPGPGVVNPTTQGVLYGVLFQKVRRQIQWVECGPNPAQFSGLYEYYEAFPLIGAAGDPAAFSLEDTFKAFGFPDEAFDLTLGAGKYVRATPANVGQLIAAYGSLPGKPDANGNNFVASPSGPGPLSFPTPGGGVGRIDTGIAPNGLSEPTAGPNFNWSNDFGGSAIDVGRSATQISICCAGNKPYVQFTHEP